MTREYNYQSYQIKIIRQGKRLEEIFYINIGQIPVYMSLV